MIAAESEYRLVADSAGSSTAPNSVHDAVVLLQDQLARCPICSSLVQDSKWPFHRASKMLLV